MPSASCLAHNHICLNAGTKHMATHTMKSATPYATIVTGNSALRNRTFSCNFRSLLIQVAFFPFSALLIKYVYIGLDMHLTWLLLLCSNPFSQTSTQQSNHGIITQANVLSCPDLIFPHFDISHLLVGFS